VDLGQAGLQGGQQGRVEAVEEQLLDQGGVARSSPAQRLPPLRGSDEARRYTEATGRAINPDALTFYRLPPTGASRAALGGEILGKVALVSRQGKTLPLPGRIVAIADVFDALTRDRVYRPALPLAETLEIMRADIGHFDIDLLELFIAEVVPNLPFELPAEQRSQAELDLD